MKSTARLTIGLAGWLVGACGLTGVATAQVELLVNGGFESGRGVGWSEISAWGLENVQNRPDLARTGGWLAWLGGEDMEVADVFQTVVIPANGAASLTFQISTVTNETVAEGRDFFRVQIDGTQVFFAHNASVPFDDVYLPRVIHLNAYADGNPHEVRFASVCDDQPDSWTNFYLDDISLRWTPDDPDPGTLPTVEFSTASSATSESVSPVGIALTVDKATADPVSVDYVVSGGSADGGGVDYTLAAGTLTFALGRLTQSIQLTVVDDVEREADETIEVTLTGPVNAVLGSRRMFTHTIVDDDTPPTVGFDVATGTGLESVSTVRVGVSLDRQSADTSRVTYALTGGTADVGDDFVLGVSTLTFDPGVTSQVVTIAVVNDVDVEPDETIELTLMATENATLGVARSYTYTIIDNDSGPPGPGGCGAMSSLVPLSMVGVLLMMRLGYRRRQ